MIEKICIRDRMHNISEYWQPEIAGELNGQYVKLVKLKGEFVMHHHEQEDEMFMVITGCLDIEFEDQPTVTLTDGEFLVIPRGVAHKPIAAREVQVMLFEPAGTINTGNIDNELTRRPGND
ncbi:MAG TPA: cupin domain-containing protein [Desulfobulbaceae bacterium]|nr:cupin domain-containing protein [Desulfobulbaceae bacterium]